MYSTLLFGGAITYKHRKLVCNYSSQKNFSLVFFFLLVEYPLLPALRRFSSSIWNMLMFLVKEKKKRKKNGIFFPTSPFSLLRALCWFWWVGGLYGVKNFAFWWLLCHLFFVFSDLYMLFSLAVWCVLLLLSKTARSSPLCRSSICVQTTMATYQAITKIICLSGMHTSISRFGYSSKNNSIT